VVPPPRPPANLGALSDAELRDMEGQERRHLEARIRVLRDIQTLLDAAVLQMNQYGILVARLEQENSTQNNDIERNGTSIVNASEASTSAAQPSTSSAEEPAPSESPESMSAEEETNLSDQERLRRRRLQRFM
jgi:E3 ubiquitin-protein ligase synoviolin